MAVQFTLEQLRNLTIVGGFGVTVGWLWRIAPAVARPQSTTVSRSSTRRLAHAQRGALRCREVAAMSLEQIASSTACGHVWPAELSEPDAACLTCGLPYKEWSQ